MTQDILCKFSTYCNYLIQNYKYDNPQIGYKDECVMYNNQIYLNCSDLDKIMHQLILNGIFMVGIHRNALQITEQELHLDQVKRSYDFF